MKNTITGFALLILLPVLLLPNACLENPEKVFPEETLRCTRWTQYIIDDDDDNDNDNDVVDIDIIITYDKEHGTRYHQIKMYVLFGGNEIKLALTGTFLYNDENGLLDRLEIERPGSDVTEYVTYDYDLQKKLIKMNVFQDVILTQYTEYEYHANGKIQTCTLYYWDSLNNEFLDGSVSRFNYDSEGNLASKELTIGEGTDFDSYRSFYYDSNNTIEKAIVKDKYDIERYYVMYEYEWVPNIGPGSNVPMEEILDMF